MTECEGMIHRFAMASRTCKCGAITVEEPQFRFVGRYRSSKQREAGSGSRINYATLKTAYDVL